MNLSPIILFTYNRPKHTKKTVESLQKNKLAEKSELYIFSDAPKNVNTQEKVQKVRDYIKTISGFKNIIITEREKNWGLAKSIISGVTEIVNKHGKVIVLEDDLITSPFFLEYMNDALSIYANKEQVMHISGYFFPIKNNNLPSTFFYNQTSCWGWATWERAWKHFDDNAKRLYEKIKERKQIKKFNIDNSNPDFEQQLIGNINGKISTWAIKWEASVFLHNGLCLHPKNSLVKNIGFDGSGINCNISKKFDVDIIDTKVNLSKNSLEENKKARLLMKKYYNKKNLTNLKILSKNFLIYEI